LNCVVVVGAICGFAGVTEMDTRMAAVTVSDVLPLTAPTDAVIIVVPVPWLLARPVPLTVATPTTDDVHVAAFVTFCVVVSEYVPVAVTCCVVPSAIEGSVGVPAIETSTAVVTVRVVEPLMAPLVAVMSDVPVVPLFGLVASPVPLMVATVVVPDVQVTVFERFWVVLFEYVPVAVNCLLVPAAMLELAGVTAMKTNWAAVTVREAVPVTEPEAAVIVAVPIPIPVARPAESIDATFVEEDDHVVEVSNWVLPSSKDPTALNCSAVPCAIELDCGVTAIETR